MKATSTSLKRQVRDIRELALALSASRITFATVILAACLLCTPLAMACDFEYDPIAMPTFYRADGWVLPGIADFTSATRSGMPGAPIKVTVAEMLSHNESPFIVEFPAQEFASDGVRERMRPMQAKVSIVRWKSHGRVIAYSYRLIPVKAYRVNKSWNVVAEVACVFTATFIDEKGDGVFRTLVKGPLTAALIPHWVRRQNSAGGPV